MSKIKLSDHFTAGRLFRFVLPSVAMMVFISIYGVVDGFSYLILPARPLLHLLIL